MLFYILTKNCKSLLADLSHLFQHVTCIASLSDDDHPTGDGMGRHVLLSLLHDAEHCPMC